MTDQLSAYVNDPANKAMDDLNTFIRFHKVPKSIEQKQSSARQPVVQLLHPMEAGADLGRT